MTLRPIRTEKDYESALERIELLWGAATGTRAGDELEVLVLLVEDYERRVHPVRKPTGADFAAVAVQGALAVAGVSLVIAVPASAGVGAILLERGECDFTLTRSDDAARNYLVVEQKTLPTRVDVDQPQHAAVAWSGIEALA